MNRIKIPGMFGYHHVEGAAFIDPFEAAPDEDRVVVGTLVEDLQGGAAFEATVYKCGRIRLTPCAMSRRRIAERTIGANHPEAAKIRNLIETVAADRFASGWED